MLRKTIIISAISLSVGTSCYAGFYIGAAGGPEGAFFNQHAHVVGYSPQAISFDVLATNHFSGTGGFGSLFGGYGKIYNQYYLAVEGNGNISSVNYEMKNDEYVHNNFATTFFTMRYSGGVSLLPGIFLGDNTLLYGRVAYTNARLKIIEGADPSIQDIIKNVNGIRYGVGIRQALSPQWIFMMDYSQINYQSVKSHTFDPIGMVAKDTRITPNTAQLALGIIYNFDVPVVYSK